MRMAILRTALWTSSMLAALGSAQAVVKSGDAAPEIRVDRLIPAQEVETLLRAHLHDKAVVMEFWATWCGPCVAAIPHWNALAAKFRDRPIVFLSVTNEEPPVVEAFLAKRPIAGIVGIAHTTTLWDDFGIGPIPQTILIDASGKVVAIGDPDLLKPGMIDDLLAGRPVHFPSVEVKVPLRAAPEGKSAPLLDVLVQPAQNGARGGSTSAAGRLTLLNASLVGILATAYQVPESRIATDGVDDVKQYDFSVSVPGASREAFDSIVKSVIDAAFGVLTRREEREVDALVLTAPHGKPAVLIGGKEIGGSAWTAISGKLSMTNVRTTDVALAVESLVRRPVVDETDLTGAYDVELSFDPTDPAALLKILRKGGFGVDTGRRRLEFVVVTRAKAE